MLLLYEYDISWAFLILYSLIPILAFFFPFRSISPH